MSAVTAPPQPIQPAAPLLRRPAVRQLLLVCLLAEIGYAVLNIATMPVYLAQPPGSGHHWIPEGRGLGTSVIGTVLVAFLLSEALLKGPMGAIADRVGHRRLMLVGPCITTCTAILTLVIPYHSGGWEILALICLRLADGAGAAMLWPAAFSYMGELVNDKERQQAMSYLNLCYMAGIALAMPIEGIVNDLSGHKYASLFLAAGMFASVAISVFRFIPAQKPAEHHVLEEHSGFDFRELNRSLHEIPGYLMLAFVTFMGIGFPMAIIKIFPTDELGMSEVGFGMLVLPAVGAMAIASVPLSRYGEKIGKAKAVHLGMALCVAGLAFASLGAVVRLLRSDWALAMGGVPVGIGFLLAIPAWMASVSEIDPKRRGANLGAVMAAQGVGAIVGAPIGATLYEKLQPVAGHHIAHYSPFIGCTICVAIGCLLSIKLLREEPRLEGKLA